MSIIKCKMCGGDMTLTESKDYGTCTFCGCTMTLPRISDEQRAAAFNRGNHFRRIGAFDEALEVYERILREDDTDAEAHWCCALCRFGVEYVEDPSAFEWIPTCHRASFDSFLEDVDYLAAIEYSDGIVRRHYQRDAAKIAEVQRSILAVSQTAEPYDIFICYKETDEQKQRTQDSALAHEIYNRLVEQGHRVFFSHISLEDMAGAQYEPYIFAALQSSRIMITIATKSEYLQSPWVKNEWSRFLAIMRKDRNRLLIPCYQDLDPSTMPGPLAALQSFNMRSIGFLQDLVHRINKVLKQEKQEQQSASVPQSTATHNSSVSKMLKRGYVALNSLQWDEALKFFEEALNLDPECADAYIGKFLITHQVRSLERWVPRDYFALDPNYCNALRFSNPQQKAQLEELPEINFQKQLSKANTLLSSHEWEYAEHWFSQALQHNRNSYPAVLGYVLARNMSTSVEDLMADKLKYLNTNVKYQDEDAPAAAQLHNQKITQLLQKYQQMYPDAAPEIRQYLAQCPTPLKINSCANYWSQAANTNQGIDEQGGLKAVLDCADEANAAKIRQIVRSFLDAIQQNLSAAQAQDSEKGQQILAAFAQAMAQFEARAVKEIPILVAELRRKRRIRALEAQLLPKLDDIAPLRGVIAHGKSHHEGAGFLRLHIWVGIIFWISLSCFVISNIPLHQILSHPLGILTLALGTVEAIVLILFAISQHLFGLLVWFLLGLWCPAILAGPITPLIVKYVEAIDLSVQKRAKRAQRQLAPAIAQILPIWKECSELKMQALRAIRPGSLVPFGYYSNSYDNPAHKELLWKVAQIQNNKVLLISDEIVSADYGGGLGRIYFSPNEEARILPTNLPEYPQPQKLFSLSKAEVSRYMALPASRIRCLADSNDSAQYWRLRDLPKNKTYVTPNGDFITDDLHWNIPRYYRPAMWVDIHNLPGSDQLLT